MRGHDEQTTHMFSYLSPEQRVPADHPLRAVGADGRSPADVAPIREPGHDRASVGSNCCALCCCRCCRSERLLMEELNDNLLFRWFVATDDPVWHPTTFTKNRDRLLSGDVAAAFFDAVQAHARAAGLLSDEHFTDGTQLEAWASLKSFRCVDAAESDPPEDGQSHATSTGSARRNDTHQSTTDPGRCCIGRAKARKPSWRISATCCWTIDGACRQRLRDPRDGDRRTRRGGAVAGGQRLPGQHGRGGQGLRSSLPTCASRTSRPTWRSAGVRSTVGPRGMRAIT